MEFPRGIGGLSGASHKISGNAGAMAMAAKGGKTVVIAAAINT